MFSKELYDAVHRFDEAFINWGAEDDAFCFKTRRIGREVIRNIGPGGTVLHLFHPKVNNAGYIKSSAYVDNRKRCACIRRMTDEDFHKYISDEIGLDELVHKYDDLGRLKVDLSWKCTAGTTLQIDSTIYDLTPDGLTFTKLLDTVLVEDGPEVAVQFIDTIILPIPDLGETQLSEIGGCRAKFAAMVKETAK